MRYYSDFQYFGRDSDLEKNYSDKFFILRLLTFYTNIENLKILNYIRKNIKIFDKIGIRTGAFKTLEVLEKLEIAQITHFKNLSSFKQLKTHIS
jgi:hypothetical protein